MTVETQSIVTKAILDSKPYVAGAKDMSKSLRSLEKRISDTENKFKSFNSSIDSGDFSKFSSASGNTADKLKKVSVSSDNASKSIMGINASSVVSTSGLANLAKGVFDFGVESVQAFSSAERLRVGLDGLSKSINSSADSMINTLSNAVGGTVDDISLMESANKALAFGIVESEEDMATLAKTAKILGPTLGLSVGKALDDMTTGLARSSKLILDNIGIVVSQGEANERFAASLGISTKALTDEQKQLAFRQEALRQMTELSQRISTETETTADKIEKTSASFTNLTIAVGELISVPAGPFFDELASGMSRLTEGAEAWMIISEELAPRASELKGQVDSLKELESITSRISKNSDELQTLSQFGDESTLVFLTSLKEQEGLLNRRLELISSTNDLSVVSNQLQTELNNLSKIDLQDKENKLSSIESIIKSESETIPLIAEQLDLVSGLVDENKNILSTLDTESELYKIISSDQEKLVAKQSELTRELGETSDNLEEHKLFHKQILSLIDAETDAIDKMNAKLSRVSAINKEFGEANRQVLSFNDKLAAGGLEAERQIQAQEALTGSSISNRIAAENNRAQQVFDNYQQEQKLIKDTEKSSISSIEKRGDKLKSTLEDLVGKALIADGIDVDAILGNPQEQGDRLNENYRRLLAIASGDIGGEAAQLFKESLPDLADTIFAEGADPVQQAKMLAEKFRSGDQELFNQLVDTERLKANVRAILLGDDGTGIKPIIDQLTSELQAEGFNIGDIQSAISQAGIDVDSGVSSGVGQSTINQIDNTSQAITDIGIQSTLTSKTIEESLNKLKSPFEFVIENSKIISSIWQEIAGIATSAAGSMSSTANSVGVPTPNAGLPGPGFSDGVTNFVVPPGFNNDSFPMRVESGEEVTVKPKGQQGGTPSVVQATIVLDTGELVGAMTIPLAQNLGQLANNQFTGGQPAI